MSTLRVEFVDVIPLHLITPDPQPLRTELNQEHIQDLIESFNVLPMGPLDPLIVKPIENNRYQIISGNHRYQALLLGGWHEAPCHIIEPISDAEEFLMKLHANTKRKQLSELETCEALVREKAIYETFYPEAKWGGNHAQEPSGQFVHTVNQGFSTIKAKTVGLSSRTLRRDIKIGQIVQEIPELKEAKATKMEAYAIAQRKPEERMIVQQALQASSNKPDTLKAFTRHEHKRGGESDAEYACRCFKDAHRLLKNGIRWDLLEMNQIIELTQSRMLWELSSLLEQEASRLQNRFKPREAC